MMNGRNNGKKLMAIRIVAHSFEIVRKKFAIEVSERLINPWIDPHHDRPEPHSNWR